MLHEMPDYSKMIKTLPLYLTPELKTNGGMLQMEDSSYQVSWPSHQLVLELTNPQGNIFRPKKIKGTPGALKVQSFQHKSIGGGLCDSMPPLPGY